MPAKRCANHIHVHQSCDHWSSNLVWCLPTPLREQTVFKTSAFKFCLEEEPPTREKWNWGSLRQHHQENNSKFSHAFLKMISTQGSFGFPPWTKESADQDLSEISLRISTWERPVASTEPRHHRPTPGIWKHQEA